MSAACTRSFSSTATQAAPTALPPPQADALAEARDAEAHLWQLLDTLEPDDRAVVVLRDVEGLSHAEVSGAMGWALSKMKTRLHRAPATLTRRYRELEGK